jgi:hypothetical protein
VRAHPPKWGCILASRRAKEQVTQPNPSKRKKKISGIKKESKTNPKDEPDAPEMSAPVAIPQSHQICLGNAPMWCRLVQWLVELPSQTNLKKARALP